MIKSFTFFWSKPSIARASRPLLAGLGLALLPLLALAQTPTVTRASLNPAANARTAPTGTTVVVPFSQNINAATAGNIRIFSQQYQGQRTASASTSGNTVTLTPTASSGSAAFKPGETVFVTVPSTVQSTGGVAAAKYVYQFTAAASGTGQGNFVAPATNPDPATGSASISVATGDVDGDGDLDLLAANSGAATVSVRLNNGSGSFGGGMDVAVGNSPNSVVVGDVDGDSDLDLLTANGDGTASVRLNNGSGSFGGGMNVAVGNGPQLVAVGDVDGDGDLDLLVANSADNTVSVRLNNGSGTFGGGSDPSVGIRPYSMAVGDVDGDGDLDLLTANATANTVSVRLNDGSGTFTTPATNPEVPVGVIPRGLAVGDVDGDGDLDFLTCNADNTVSVRLNDGSGSFVAPATNPNPAVSNNPLSVALGDVDGDGDLDFLASNGNNTVNVRLNNGSGDFGGGTDPSVGDNPQIVVVGDLDGDGDLDLLTANYGDNTVSVRLNTGIPSITSFTPTSGPTGSTISLTGSSLAGVTAITFTGTGGNVVTTGFTVNAAGTQITGIVVPAGAQTGTLTVTTPDGTSAASSQPFTVTAAAPVLAAVAPAFGPVGAIVSLTGTNLSGATAITFSGANGNVVTTGFTVASSTSLTGIIVPAGAQSGPVWVTTPGGTSAVGTAFFSLTRTLSASSSGDHTLQVRPDGSLWAWGSNGNGQLGDGSYANQASPVHIGTATNWVSVSAGQFHSLALRADGTIWGWGRNSEGQVGDGTGGQQGTPVQVGTDTNWVSVVAGTYHSLAVKADGTLWTWGYNGFGQLGYGTYYYGQYVPQQVGTDHDWANVTAGASHVVAVKANGTLWTWGYNGAGGLGNGSTSNNSTPMQVGTDMNWLAPFPSENNTLVLKTTGALWSWGQNGSGQLGDGTTTDRYYPAQLGTDTDWRRAASSGGHTLALRTSGTLWSWGSNSNGQLGDGTTTAHYLPAQVGAATNWVSVGAGNGHSVGEQDCPSAWAWGQNSSGQLGTGNTTDLATMVEIYNPTPPSPAITTWNGSNSTDWNSCANWSGGQVPNATFSAVIPAGLANYPSLPLGTYYTNGLTLASGASLTTAAGATLQVSGDWANNGGTATLAGPVQFVGTAAQTIGGSASTAFGPVVVNKASGSLTLGRDLAIGNSLALTSGTLSTTASYKVALGSDATLSESETSYVSGAVEVTRTLSMAGTGSTFGGVGLSLTPASGSTALPGSTLVRRVTGSPVTSAGGNMGIGRYFAITPVVDTNLNVTMVFGYFDHELNSISEANLKLYKSDNGTSGPWQPQAGTSNDAVANTVTKPGITSLSTWTLGNSAAPLPVQLVAFTATTQDRRVALAWRTASEVSSARFEVERSTDGVVFAEIGQVAAQGSKPTATDYALLDSKLPTGLTKLYYRLRQVDLDGTATYSPVRTVALAGTTDLVAYPVPARAGQVLTVAGAPAGSLFEVLDALGRRVASAPADTVGAAQLALPTGLAAGVYVLHGGVQVQRLVVE